MRWGSERGPGHAGCPPENAGGPGFGHLPWPPQQLLLGDVLRHDVPGVWHLPRSPQRHSCGLAALRLHAVQPQVVRVKPGQHIQAIERRIRQRVALQPQRPQVCELCGNERQQASVYCC